MVWDGTPVSRYYNAIVWQDTRTDQICSELKEGGQDRFRKGRSADRDLFRRPKSWILDNVAGARAAAERGDALFGTIDS